MDKDSPKTLFHYTKLKNLTSIIRKNSHDEAELVFWLTNFKQLDDISEGGYIRKMLTKADSRFSFTSLPDMYVLSLCKKPDCLPMWKEYADDVRGIVLALNSEILLQSKYRSLQTLYPCQYNEKTNFEFIRQVVNNINQYIGSKDWENHLFQISHYAKEHPDFLKDKRTILASKYSAFSKEFAPILAFKDKHYFYEKEYRLIYDNYTPSLLNYRVKDNRRMIEYWEFHVSIDALEGIYVGSNNNKSTIDVIKKYIANLALKKNVFVEDICIPYRT